MNISSEIKEKIICPETNERLVEEEGRLCNSNNKSISYPIIDNIPILISNNKSIFSVEDFQKKLDTTWELKPNRIFSLIKKLSPSIGLNIKAKNTDISSQENLIPASEHSQGFQSFYRKLLAPLLDNRAKGKAMLALVLILFVLAALLPVMRWVPLKLLPFDNKHVNCLFISPTVLCASSNMPKSNL